MKLSVDTAVMSTVLNSSHNSRIGPHTSAHVPTHAAARMLSIEVSPMPPSFITGNVYYKETVAEQLTLI